MIAMNDGALSVAWFVVSMCFLICWVLWRDYKGERREEEIKRLQASRGEKPMTYLPRLKFRIKRDTRKDITVL